MTFSPGFGKRHKQTGYGYYYLRDRLRVLRTETRTSEVSISKGHSLLHMSVHMTCVCEHSMTPSPLPLMATS